MSSEGKVTSEPVFVEYVDMTPDQQRQVSEYLVCKALPLTDCHLFAFRVNPDGSVRKQRGRHKPSKEYEVFLKH